MLTLLSFWRIEASIASEYKNFFHTEVQSHVKSLNSEGTAILTMKSDLTPLRRQREAETMSAAICSPEPWSKRTRSVA
jgi:hypothetical protein